MLYILVYTFFIEFVEWVKRILYLITIARNIHRSVTKFSHLNINHDQSNKTNNVKQSEGKST